MILVEKCGLILPYGVNNVPVNEESVLFHPERTCRNTRPGVSTIGVSIPFKAKTTLFYSESLDAPTGIRTPVLALKGLRPGPLDDGGACLIKRMQFYHSSCHRSRM